MIKDKSVCWLVSFLYFPFCLFGQTHEKPIIDQGVFVIQGLPSCGNGTGYCILGYLCEVDDDFLPDKEGHCEGLRNSFSPVSEFICCAYNDEKEMLKKNHASVNSDIRFTEDFFDFLRKMGNSFVKIAKYINNLSTSIKTI